MGTWEISPESASSHYYSLKIEQDGAASTVGEPLATQDPAETPRACGGTARLPSRPVSMTLTCADAETADDGTFHHMRRHAGELRLGPPPPLLREYGDEALIIDWANGTRDYLFPGNT